MKLLEKIAQKKVVKIHNEIDTAQDRLLEQALKMITNTAEDLISKSERLKKVGFINSPQVKIGESLSLTKESAGMILHYKNAYPFRKFLTEAELDRICEKYNLTYMAIDRYIKDVPDKNLRDIETAVPLSDDDKEKILYRFSDDGHRGDEKMFLQLLGKKEPVFSQSEIRDLLIKCYRYAPQEWTDFSKSAFSTAFYVISSSMPGMKGKTVSYNKCTAIAKEGLFIAAPSNHFDNTGLIKKGYGFFKVSTYVDKDPIVFEYCKGGISVITKWGLEASDELLINPIDN